MAKASSTPGTVSMMSLRGGGDAGEEAGDADRDEEASTGALVCVAAGDAIRVEEASTRASMSVVAPTAKTVDLERAREGERETRARRSSRARTRDASR